MKISNLILLGILATTSSFAATITFGTSEVDLGQSVPGTYGNITNEWSSFGIMVENAILYNDPRDSFDNIGLSGLERGGVITFAQTVNQLQIDYLITENSGGTFQIFDLNDVSVGALSVATGNSAFSGSFAFAASGVKKLIFTPASGMGANLSTLRFVSANEVPEPSTWMIFSAGLAAIAARRRMSQR